MRVSKCCHYISWSQVIVLKMERNLSLEMGTGKLTVDKEKVELKNPSGTLTLEDEKDGKFRLTLQNNVGSKLSVELQKDYHRKNRKIIRVEIS